MTQRLLYIGNLRDGGNGRDRMSLLTVRGYQAEGFDTRPYRGAGPRLTRSLTARGWGPAVVALNRALDRRAQHGGFDLVMVDKEDLITLGVVNVVKTTFFKLDCVTFILVVF